MLQHELSDVRLDTLESVTLLPAEDRVSLGCGVLAGDANGRTLGGPALAAILMRWCALQKVPLPKKAAKSLAVLEDSVVINITFALPATSRVNGGSPGCPQGRSDLRGMGILIVDDEPFMRSTLVMLLRGIDRSFAVTAAGDGETALRLISETKPELVLCDVHMEPMGGLEAVERLRGHTSHALRATPVIMLTAHDDDATIQRAAALDIKGYLVKPASPTQLAELIKGVFPDRKREAVTASAR